MKAFIASEFGYFPLLRMFRNRKLNTIKLHERALRIVYPDYPSSFTELLTKENSTSIHNRNIQLLVTELFKVKNGLLPSFMKEIFVENAWIWARLHLKSNNFEEFKLKKLWNPENCPSRLCKMLLQQVGFYNMPFDFLCSIFYHI